MEDLDGARMVPGSADEILRSLEAFGLYWDGEVEYQSRRTHLYAEALESLRAGGLTFECSCSRRELATEESGYPGTCREGPRRPGDTATRLRVDETATIAFDDRFQGPIALPWASWETSSCVAGTAFPLPARGRRRRCPARRSLTSCGGRTCSRAPAGRSPCSALCGLPTPRYAHLPLLLERSGEKLSKSRRSVALDVGRAGVELLNALRLLGLSPPAELADADARHAARMGDGLLARSPLPLPRELILRVHASSSHADHPRRRSCGPPVESYCRGDIRRRRRPAWRAGSGPDGRPPAPSRGSHRLP